MTAPAPTTAPQCWILYRKPDRPGWLNRLVISPDGHRFHISHNGSRLARNSDAERLGARRPDVLAWAAAALAENQQHETTNRD